MAAASFPRHALQLAARSSGNDWAFLRISIMRNAVRNVIGLDEARRAKFDGVYILFAAECALGTHVTRGLLSLNVVEDEGGIVFIDRTTRNTYATPVIAFEDVRMEVLQPPALPQPNSSLAFRLVPADEAACRDLVEFFTSSYVVSEYGTLVNKDLPHLEFESSAGVKFAFYNLKADTRQDLWFFDFELEATRVDDEEEEEEEEEPEEPEYEVEEVVYIRERIGNGTALVKWKGFDSRSNSWVRAADLHCPLLVNKYYHTLPHHA